MKRFFLILVVGLLTTNPGALYAESKTGPAKFTGVGKETVNVALGGKLKLDATFQQIDVGGISAVSVAAKINNPTNGKLHYAYHVAFLDKDKNPVGCQHFTLFVDGGKQNNAGTFITLPAAEIARIASYSVAFHEGEKQIGSK